MKLRLTSFFILSFFIHIFVFIFFSQIFQYALVQPISVQIMNEETEQKALQLVDQSHFNDQTPDDDYYLSQSNNYTLHEQKGKPGKSLNHPAHSELAKTEAAAPSLSFKAFSSLLGNIDFLDVETEGAYNLLNTKEVLFYTFYSRVKHQIYWHWEKALISEMEVSDFAPEKQFMTHVEALFNSEGYLRSVIIRKKSGLDELDRASIHAIQRAQPFPNPPEKLISDTGSFKLNYTFVLVSENTSSH